MKVPTPERMSSGNWFIRLRLGGENINITAPTKTECIQQAQLIKAEHRAGKLEAKRDMPTLGEAIDEYISRRSNVLSPATIRGYKGIRRNRFGSYMNDSLDDIDWQQIVNEEARKVSPKTVMNAWGLVVSVLGDNGINPGKIRRPAVVLNETPWLDEKEIPVFLEAIRGTEVEIPALLELHSLRSSEMEALTWERNIDTKKWRIKVAGAVVPDENHKPVYKEANKNAASRREIPIFIAQLREALKGAPAKTGKVVTISAGTVRNRINRICRDNDLPEVGNHGLRRSFASLCMYAGLSERECMEFGGWSDLVTMHKHYVKLSNAAKQSAEKKLEGIFNSSSKTSSKTE